jgi:hypothetical protein
VDAGKVQHRLAVAHKVGEEKFLRNHPGCLCWRLDSRVKSVQLAQ